MFSRPAFVVLIAVCFLTSSPPALAHTLLERSWPRAEETVAAAPAALRLLFSERVEPALAHMTMTDAEGHAVGLGAVAIDARHRRTLIVPIPAALHAGAYVVVWRVVSADGHPMEGYPVGSRPARLTPQQARPDCQRSAADIHAQFDADDAALVQRREGSPWPAHEAEHRA